MKENFPNVAKEIHIPTRKHRVSNKLDPKRATPKHIIIKTPKVNNKKRTLKAAREKKRVTNKGVLIRLSADFLIENLQARKDCQEVFKVIKSSDLHPRLLYPAKLSFRMEGQIKCFPGKLKKFLITKPLLYEMLNGFI